MDAEQQSSFYLFMSKVIYITHMLNIIANINNRNIITKDSILVNFDIVNIFPSFDNVLSLEAVS